MKILRKTLAALIVTAILLASSAMALPPSSEVIYMGIDISKYQGTIDFERVSASGIEIVYIRSSASSDYEDPNFERNYAAARAAGLRIGFYHSMTAQTEAEAEAQANFFLGIIAGKTHEGRLAMDYGYIHNLTTAQANANAEAFLRELNSRTDEEPLIYTDASGARDIWSDEIASIARLWVAQYGVDEPEDNGKWDSYVGWQYSDTGRIPGISGNVDLDRFTEDILLDTPSTVPGEKVPVPSSDRKLITVIVERGDTLSRLAAEYDTTVASLVRLNDIRDPDLIFIGERLYVETDISNEGERIDTYTVRRGDTLWRIAKRFSTTVNRLTGVNEIRDPDLIFIDQILDLGF